METVEINAVAGVRNDVSPERFSSKDLLTGVNIDIDKTGKIYRRLAHALTTITGAAHSLFSSGRHAYVVLDGVLSFVSPDLSVTPIVPVSGARVSYAAVDEDVYWTDGQQSGILRAAANRKWGITPPLAPAVSAAGGTFRAGKYLYTMTYIRENGEESGAALYGSIDLIAGEGLAVSMPVAADPTVTHKRFYLSAVNGELPYLVGTYANEVISATISDTPLPGVNVRTQFVRNAPAGQLARYAFGRMWVAQGTVLWYSLPNSYELFLPMTDYIALPSTVRTFSPVSDGIFVGTDDETVFLQGTDPSSMRLVPKASYGTLLGTENMVPEYQFLDGKAGEDAAVWMSQRGLCLGLSGGQFKNLTGGRYIPPLGPTAGASLLKIRGGTPQLVVSTFRE